MTAYDEPIQRIADYVCDAQIDSEEAFATARLCLMDSLGCALLALQFPACTKLLGPLVVGTQVPEGSRVPGTSWELDPVRAAFNIGTMVRWLDFNDTWLAAEWGHPSDNLGALLAVADHRTRLLQRGPAAPWTMRTLLQAMIQAHEIQGILALENSFNRQGIDHVILVRVASAALATKLLGGNKDQVLAAVSNAWVDGGSLRCYRHFPNTGTRKSWAAGDATSRGVELAYKAISGEMGYPTVLSERTWGFYDCFYNGQTFSLPRPFGSYVMEQILFKVSYPAEFHAQTAVEAAIQLHDQVKERIDVISKITIDTHESALRIIDKRGPLTNPADRDHCLQYMTAVALLKGGLSAEDYEEEAAQNPRIDFLREKIVLHEEPRFTKEYLDPDKRSIANAIQVHFSDGSATEKVVVEYPLGHRRRREEARPLLIEKFKKNTSHQWNTQRVGHLVALFEDSESFDSLTVADFMSRWV